MLFHSDSNTHSDGAMPPRRDVPSESCRPMRRFMARHRFFLSVMAVLAVANVLRAPFYREFMLLASDWNAVNIVQMASGKEMSPLDDFEAGHWRDHIVLTTAYFWGPFLLSKIGIPADTAVILHEVFGPLLLLVGLYYLSLVLFGNREVAALTAALFLFCDAWIFKLNVGYPILFGYAHYYNDMNHVFAVFALAFLLDRKPIPAGIAAGLLAMGNVTHGFAVTLILLGYIAVGLRRDPGLNSKTIGALVIAGTGLLVSFLLIKVAGPQGEASPPEARTAAIRSYGHLAIHAQNPLLYLKAMAVIAAGLAYVVFFEAYVRQRLMGACNARFLRFAIVGAGITLLFGLGTYWLTYIIWPEAFVILSPAKPLMVLCIYLSAYVSAALFHVISRHPLAAVTVLAAFVLNHVFNKAALDMYWVLAVASLAASALLATRARWRKKDLAVSQWLLLPILALPIADVVYRRTKPFTSGRVALAAELIEISRKVNTYTQPEALIVPYRVRGTRKNFMGPFQNLALRTYSRRGYYAFWSVGRNTYFDSMVRHNREERAFEAAGLDLWQDGIRQLRDSREKDAFAYFTGVQVRLDSTPAIRFRFAGPAEVWIAKRRQLIRFVDESTPTQFAEYARRLGATHLIVSRDAGMKVPWPSIVAETKHFALVRLDPNHETRDDERRQPRAPNAVSR
jgi:hypothetical protein